MLMVLLQKARYQCQLDAMQTAGMVSGEEKERKREIEVLDLRVVRIF